MRPVKLTMSAFGPYSDIEVIDFTELQERNLFLVTGATGSGKTTIFDAISYALYGRASGDLRTEDTLRSHFSEPDVLTEVQLTFELKGITYHVHRTPKQIRPKAKSEGYTEQKPDATLTIEDAEPRTVVTGVSKVNRKIEEILGINVEQFKQIMMIPQGEFRKLLTSDSQEREKVLQQLFDTYIYKRIQNELNEQAKTLGSDIKSKKVARDTLVTKIKYGEDPILQEMITAEDKFIDVIVKKTNALIDSDKKVVDHLVDALEKVDKRIESNLKEQAKALEDNKNLARKESLTKELGDQDLMAPSMAKQQQQILQGEKAARLLGTETNIFSRDSALVGKVQEQKAIEGQLKQLVLDFEVAKKALDLETSTEVEAKKNTLKRQFDNYKSYLPKVEGLKVLTKEIMRLESKHKEILASIEHNKQQTTNLTNRLQEQQKTQESLKDTAVLLEKAKNRYEKEEVQRNQLEKVMTKMTSWSLVENNRKRKAEGLEKALKVYETEDKAFKEGKYLFLMNQAAFLAKELEVGDACPVCGSLEHPSLAQLSEEAITEEALEQLELKMTAAEQKYRKAMEILAVQEERCSSHQKSHEELVVEVYGEDATALLEKNISEQEANISQSVQVVEGGLREIEEEIARLVVASKRYETLTKEITNDQHSVEILEQEGKGLEEQKLSLVTDMTEKKTNLKHVLEEVPEEMRQLTALRSMIKETETLITQKDQQLKEVRSKYDTANNRHIEVSAKNEQLLKSLGEDRETLASLKGSFIQLLHEAGFVTLELYMAAKMDEKQLESMKETQAGYHRNLDRLKQSIKEIIEKTKGIQMADLAIFVTIHEEQQENRLNLTNQQGTVKARITDNKDTVKHITTINDQIKDKETKYNVVGRLARIAQGINPAMMTFERYVLAAFLEDILKAANTRLRQMTQGRYILSRTSELQRKNKQSGLELEVFDNFTGKSRHVKTLSGGEGFKASLSMALGLSDVVQSYAGGVRLDTMFIDEGFGTLDQESLDSAINCLIDLQKSGRLVGIISHVQELKERIDTRLEILSTNKGSESRFVLG